MTHLSAHDEGSLRTLLDHLLPTSRSPFEDAAAAVRRHVAGNSAVTEWFARPLTQLQRITLGAARAGELDDVARSVLLMGPTSSGKSTVADMLMLRAFRDPGRQASAAYIGPTRQLVHDRYEEFLARFGGDSIPGGVVLSTGEHGHHDVDIASGRYGVAFLVYEKARLLFAHDAGSGPNLEVLVVDEIHMLADPQRGGRLEVKLIQAAQRKVGIVAVTTESAEDRGLMRFLERPSLYGATLPPVVIRSNERPVRVHHHLVLAGTPFEIVEVAQFPVGSDARTLAPKALAATKAALQSAWPRVERGLPAQHPHGERRRRTLAFLDAWLDDHPKGRRLLVVAPRISEVRAIADALVARRGARPALPLPRGLDGAVIEESDQDVKDRATRLARAGVYEHFRHVRPAVAGATARFFTELPGEDEDTKVLVATDTLAYGVNLAVDTVVLSGTTFHRSTRLADQVTTDAIDPTRFHNILGRAGRLGLLRQDQADVFVVVDHQSVGAESVDRVHRHFVQRYYGSPPVLVSALFQPENDAGASLEDMSSPWVQAVLDLLQFCSRETRSATVSDVVALLDRSFWMALQPNRTAAHATLREAVERTLTSACVSTPPLVARLDGAPGEAPRFAIGPLGVAVIETGTSFADVEVMLDAVHRIDRAFAAADAGTPPPLFRLVLPALLAPSTRGSAYRYAFEIARPEQISRADVAREAGRLWTSLLPFLPVGSDHPGQVLGRELWDAANAILKSPQMTRACFRMLAAIGYWIRGDARQRRAVLTPVGSGTVVELQGRWDAFVLSVSWRLAVVEQLALREAPPSEPTEVGMMAMQVRHGCERPEVRYHALPRSPSEWHLRHHEVRRLHVEGWTAARVTRERPPQIRGIVGVTRMPVLLGRLRTLAASSMKRAASIARAHARDRIEETLVHEVIHQLVHRHERELTDGVSTAGTEDLDRAWRRLHEFAHDGDEGSAAEPDSPLVEASGRTLLLAWPSAPGGRIAVVPPATSPVPGSVVGFSIPALVLAIGFLPAAELGSHFAAAAARRGTGVGKVHTARDLPGWVRLQDRHASADLTLAVSSTFDALEDTHD